MMFHLLTLCFLVPSTAAALPPASSIKAIPKATNAPEAQMPLAAALKSADGQLALTDERGRRVIVPANLVAYIEIAQADQRRVGFVVGD